MPCLGTLKFLTFTSFDIFLTIINFKEYEVNICIPIQVFHLLLHFFNYINQITNKDDNAIVAKMIIS